jgi:hypothetical protein
MTLAFSGSPGPWSLGSKEAKNEPLRSEGLKKVRLLLVCVAGIVSA